MPAPRNTTNVTLDSNNNNRSEGSPVDDYTWSFTTAGAKPPTITRFTPDIGKIGTRVTITGTNFTGATAVKFDGVAATAPTITNTSITANVPTGAVTGRITVTTPAGTATSATNFIVDVTPPTITISNVTQGSFVKALPTAFAGGTNDNNGINRVTRVTWYLRRTLNGAYQYWNTTYRGVLRWFIMSQPQRGPALTQAGVQLALCPQELI